MRVEDLASRLGFQSNRRAGVNPPTLQKTVPVAEHTSHRVVEALVGAVLFADYCDTFDGTTAAARQSLLC